MIRIFLALLFVFMICFSLASQVVSVVSGGDAFSSVGSMSCTVGQLFPVYEEGTSVGAFYAAVQLPFEMVFVKSSVEDGVDVDDVTVYPNPTSGYVLIDYPSASHIAYVLMNSLGQQVKCGKDETELDISDLDAGMYFLIVEMNNESKKTYKLIKE